MDEDTFWELVDEAREEGGNDDERFLEVLEKGLMELPPNAIEAFASGSTRRWRGLTDGTCGPPLTLSMEARRTTGSSIFERG